MVVELLGAQERVEFAVGCLMLYNRCVQLISGSLSPLCFGGVAPGCGTASQKLWRCKPRPCLASHLHLVGLRERCVAIAMAHTRHVPHFGATSDAGLWLVMLPG